ncbi:hypothetical protein BU14_0673s0006 [Porphyra umbilicalis]|uniref:Phosphatase PP2A regulatory subunit A/Splicing factor 3B subunit 1-like HEAT repeat domain-containing protein n=1 Tax=Porphyra umbilicalis TaxID=2786 RepID=A0A1X6NQ64_PORUM|nr:hypothetical protein BU14_0673s0006 [Porphyra umbilicalis]|eukprot:OSX70754.1 hypothetical protein BU14_0673s0006 [Porphyra umbilicalis]
MATPAAPAAAPASPTSAPVAGAPGSVASDASASNIDQSLMPIAVLLDELKNENVKLRMHATRRLKTIAAALGPERTRCELLPFLMETIDDEDEVLLVLSDELGDFVGAVGGVDHAAALLEPLESLSMVEETCVRDRAVEALRRILATVVSESVDRGAALHASHLFPLLRRVATGDWFTSRISACALFACTYRGLPVQRVDLRTECLSLFKQLASDDTPMVRRAAASNLGDLARAVAEVEPSLIASELVPIFCELVDDEQDSVRLLVVENAAAVAALIIPGTAPVKVPPTIEEEAPAADAMAGDKTAAGSDAASGSGAAVATSEGGASEMSDGPNDAAPATTPVATSVVLVQDDDLLPQTPVEPNQQRDDFVLPVVRKFVADKSWRVRYMVADQLSDLCDALGARATRSELLPSFLRLLKDGEPEVRTAAAFKVTHIARRVAALESGPDASDVAGAELLTRDMLPVVRELVRDSSQHVRAALAGNIMGLAPVLGEAATASELLEMILILLKDDFPDVRLNVIARLDKVSFVMGMVSNELLPAIVELAEDRNWRVRLAIIEHMPLLARQLGADFFDGNTKLGSQCMHWLGDCVYSIRDAATVNLRALTEVFGVDWAKQHIVPQVLQQFASSTNYLYRMTALQSFGVLAAVLPAETVEKSFLPVIVERACKDPVPNIRFGAAKTLQQIIPYVRSVDVRDALIRPSLQTLASDGEKDKDVSFFAHQALASMPAAA